MKLSDAVDIAHGLLTFKFISGNPERVAALGRLVDHAKIVIETTATPTKKKPKPFPFEELWFAHVRMTGEPIILTFPDGGAIEGVLAGFSNSYLKIQLSGKDGSVLVRVASLRHIRKKTPTHSGPKPKLLDNKPRGE